MENIEVNSEISEKCKSILIEYKPFIEAMIRKLHGTALKPKWEMLSESLMKPKKKLTIARLECVESTLADLRKREEEAKLTDKKNEVHPGFDLSITSASSNESVESTKSSHDVSSEHSYARLPGVKLTKKHRLSDEEIAERYNRYYDDDGNLVIEDDLDDTLPSVDGNGSLLEEVETFEEEIRQEIASTQQVVEVVKADPVEKESKSFRNELTQPSSIEEIPARHATRRSCTLKRTSTSYSEIDHEEMSESKRLKLDEGKVKNCFVQLQRIQTKATARKSTSVVDEPKKLIVPSRRKTVSHPQRKITPEVKSKSSESEEEFRGWSREERVFDESLVKIARFRPAPPAPVFQLWTYKTVCNMAYAKSRRGHVYKCLITDCPFQTLVEDSLVTHLERKHENHKWNGFCNLCENVIASCGTMMDEFAHMTEMHLKKDEKKTSRKQIAKELKAPTETVLTKLPPKENPVTQPALKISSVESIITPSPKVTHKDPEQVKSKITMQTIEGLSATFKCMSSTCSFYTIDDEIFKKHLNFHEKFTFNDKTNFMDCAYCEFVGSNAQDLTDHVKNSHVHDRFQCNYCFYRSCTDFNVFTHQNQMHVGKENKIIECVEVKTRDTRAEIELVKKSREENVPPLICVFCRGIFFAKQTFLDHVEGHDGNLKARCIECGEKTSPKDVHKHLKRCHGLGMFQCVYCQFGTDDFEKLNNHIANLHPSKVPLFCERVELRNADGTLKHPSPSVVETICLKAVKQVVNKKFLVKASNDKVKLTNEENAGKLRADLTVYKMKETQTKSTKQKVLKKIIHSTDKKVAKVSPLSKLVKPLQV